MKMVHETRHVNRFDIRFTQVMVESVADDVAVYHHDGHVSADICIAYGRKLSEREAKNFGFTVPAGKYYRR